MRPSSSTCAPVGSPAGGGLGPRERTWFKTELIHHRGPWRSVDAVEYATPERADRFDHRRLLEPIGNLLAAELEARYFRQRNESAMMD